MTRTYPEDEGRSFVEMFVTPRLVDGILALVALEFAGLGALLVHWRAPRLVGPLLLHLAAGAFLLVALRMSLAGSEASWIALALLASGVAHVLSLQQAYRAMLWTRTLRGNP